MISSTSVIGLGKLGACMAACFASKGFKTIGVDMNTEFVAKMNDGIAPVEETGLSELVLASKENISATTDYEQAILNSDGTFVIVPTPSLPNGDYSIEYTKNSFRDIGKALAKKNEYHLVVLTSTVLPGKSEADLISVLEESSGKKCGTDFGYCYSPEFIALGSVIRDFMHPDLVLIGEYDQRSGEALENFYHKVCNNTPSIARMSVVDAELTKISINSFMTMKISFANMLSLICDRLENADVDVVTNAITLFGGVGKKSFKGGLGYGGPCLPRDNVALSYLTSSLGLEIGIPSAVDEFNDTLVGYISKTVSTLKPKQVTLLGLSYKPDTHITERSQAIDIFNDLTNQDYVVKCLDPKVRPDSLEVSKDKNFHFYTDFSSDLVDTDVIVVATPDPFLKKMTDLLKTHQKPVAVIDPWGLVNDVASMEHVNYIPIGRFNLKAKPELRS